MRPTQKHFTAAMAALLVAAVLFVVILLSAGALAANAPSSDTTSGKITYSKVIDGWASYDQNPPPDVLVLPSPPSGIWWKISSIELIVQAPDKKNFRQPDLLYTRFVENPTGFPDLHNPNLDVLARDPVPYGLTGTFIGEGGVGSSPNPAWNWTQWEVPITLNSEVQIVLCGNLGTGNTITVEVDYTDLGAGTTVVKYDTMNLVDGWTGFTVGPAPSGQEWYVMNAFAYLIAATGGSGRSVSIVLEPKDLVLLKGSAFPYEEKVRETGGYSTAQTAPGLTAAGVQVIWMSPLYLSGSDYIKVSFEGLSTSDQAKYAVGFTQLPLSAGTGATSPHSGPAAPTESSTPQMIVARSSALAWIVHERAVRLSI